MNKKQSDQFFTIALKFLIKKEGRGTQAQLAKKIGINPGHLSNIVHGKISPSEKIQKKIAQFFEYHLWHMVWLGEWISAGWPGELWDDAIAFVKAIDWSDFLKIDPFSEYCEDDFPNVHFIIGLNYLLMRKGGSIAKKQLSKQCNIEKELLDELLIGNYSLLKLPDYGSQEDDNVNIIDKIQIAKFFNLDFQAIDKLGFWITELYDDIYQTPTFPITPYTMINKSIADNQYLSPNDDNKKNIIRTNQNDININLLASILSTIDKILDSKDVEITKEKKAKIAAMTYQELIKSNYDVSVDNLAYNEVLQNYIDLAI